MNNERRQILDMLATGKSSADEAERLLDALTKQEEPEAKPTACGSPKYLRIVVQEGDHGKDNVNIRIPLALVKAGMKLTSLIPESARNKVNNSLSEKGLHIDLNNLDSATVDEIILALKETSIDVQDGDEKVRICCE